MCVWVQNKLFYIEIEILTTVKLYLNTKNIHNMIILLCYKEDK